MASPERHSDSATELIPAKTVPNKIVPSDEWIASAVYLVNATTDLDFSDACATPTWISSRDSRRTEKRLIRYISISFGPNNQLLTFSTPDFLVRYNSRMHVSPWTKFTTLKRKSNRFRSVDILFISYIYCSLVQPYSASSAGLIVEGGVTPHLVALPGSLTLMFLHVKGVRSHDVCVGHLARPFQSQHGRLITHRRFRRAARFGRNCTYASVEDAIQKAVDDLVAHQVMSLQRG